MKQSNLTETVSLIKEAIASLQSLRETSSYEQRKRALHYLSMGLEEVNSLSGVVEGNSRLLLE